VSPQPSISSHSYIVIVIASKLELMDDQYNDCITLAYQIGG